MSLDLTATPIMVAENDGRIVYKNVAAKKLIPECRVGYSVMQYLSAVGEDRYLRICTRNDEIGIIRFLFAGTVCREAVAGTFELKGRKHVAFVFLSFLQHRGESEFYTYAEAVALRAGKDLVHFVSSSGKLVNKTGTPTAARSFARRNTAVYDISSGLSDRMVKNTVKPDVFLNMLKEISNSRMRTLGYRLMTDHRISIMNNVPVGELVKFTYAFLPASMLMLRAAGGNGSAVIRCENGAVSACITAMMCEDKNIRSDLAGLAVLGEAIGYDDIPGLIAADAVIEGDGLGFSYVLDKKSENEPTRFSLEFSLPITEIREAVLFAPAEELLLERQIATALYEFFDTYASFLSADGTVTE